ncbi:MAG TPA: YHS domain-containing protein [Bacteroidia bacterium]|jgi:YHS domain-containing protein
MKKRVAIFFLVSLTGIWQSCAIFLYQEKKGDFAVDPVCEMKVDKSEAYTYTFNGTEYYFDNYNCKQAFRMNPGKYLENKCNDRK